MKKDFGRIEKMLFIINNTLNERERVMKLLKDEPLTERQKIQIETAELKIEEKIIKPLQEVLCAIHNN